MNADKLLAKAQSGDPQAAFEYGLHCIKIGYADTGKQWLDFAKSRGSVDASIELGLILNKEGNPVAARAALVLASEALHPRALFVAGLTYMSEGDYELAHSLFSAAVEQGVQEATTIKEAAWMMLLSRELENREITKVQNQAEALLSGQQALEGAIPLRPDWWMKWWPDLSSEHSIGQALQDYLADFDWQLIHFVKNLAVAHDAAHWNQLAAISNSDERTAQTALDDPLLLQRAVGFISANDVAQLRIWRAEIERRFADVAGRTNVEKVTASLPLFADAYEMMNPEALPRVLTLLPYYLWQQARELKATLELEGALSAKQLSGAITRDETASLLTAREAIINSRSLNLDPFERSQGFLDSLPQAFPAEPHEHLRGDWPRRGWVRYLGPNRANSRPFLPFSGCSFNFRCGGWRCETPESASSAAIQGAAVAPKPAQPAKKVAGPIKKALPPAKKVAGPSKKAAAPAQKTTEPPTIDSAERYLNAPSSASEPSRPILCLLMDELVAEGDFLLPDAPQHWTSRSINVGPVQGELEVQGHWLKFSFILGKFSGKTGSTNLAENIARSVSGPGISFSASLQPQPEVKMRISIPSAPDVDSQLVAMTLMQVANAVIQAFQAAVQTKEMISPSASDLEKFGLVPPGRLGRSNGSRNWGKENAGAKFLLGEF